ncbi:STAGA complex 65 subunit gamma [Leptinotarsa decemlineata]|uniref:STAGA complex 65 subunit gamma n=1 Tax=Leptinotarsa decemlineata TaxID=7539 RepID=UPI003D305DDF
MLYAISLHKYANDMRKMTELATEMNIIPSEDAAPPMPIMPEFELKHKRNNLNYIPKDFTSFSCGSEIDIPELSEAVVKEILPKCIVTMFAHIGFETSHQSVLDVLSDVLETFLQKICHKIVDAVEDEDREHTSGFPNVIEKVLTEIGMGGVKGLNDYYQNRVVKYVNVLKKRCKELNDNYAALLVPKSPSNSDKLTNVVRVKVEEDEDLIELDNPEVHFAAFDGETPSVLETGLQLLNSLEAEENLQTLEDTTEGDISSASPGVSMPPESEVCNLSPFTKKKRFK